MVICGATDVVSRGVKCSGVCRVWVTTGLDVLRSNLVVLIADVVVLVVIHSESLASVGNGDAGDSVTTSVLFISIIDGFVVSVDVILAVVSGKPGDAVVTDDTSFCVEVVVGTVECLPFFMIVAEVVNSTSG